MEQPMVLEYRSSDLPERRRWEGGFGSAMVGIGVIAAAVVIVNAVLICLAMLWKSDDLALLGVLFWGAQANALILLLGLWGIPIVMLRSRPMSGLVYFLGALVIPASGYCITFLAACGGHLR